jgi:hypothetical protein
MAVIWIGIWKTSFKGPAFDSRPSIDFTFPVFQRLQAISIREFLSNHNLIPKAFDAETVGSSFYGRDTPEGIAQPIFLGQRLEDRSEKRKLRLL